MKPHYFLVRDGVIENRIVWDGERPYDPGEGAMLVPEESFSTLKIGDEVPELNPPPSEEDGDDEGGESDEESASSDEGSAPDASDAPAPPILR